MRYRVLIPTAGTGSRLNNATKHINKSLLSVGNKPIISHIIEKFPKDIEIVIPLGYKGDILKQYLVQAHPERTFIFTEVNKYEGLGSGLGYSIYTAKMHLQCPFIFCSNDTIVKEEIPEPTENWIGYTELDDVSHYRSIRLNSDSVIELCEKDAHGDVKAYIGLSGIFDYKEFWAAMDSQNDAAIATGESHGLRAILNKGIKSHKFTWFDTGNPRSLGITREFFRKEDEPNILDKEEEAIWFVNDRVVKFSIDTDFIKNRVARTQSLDKYVPEIIGSDKNIYVYRKVEGEIFSKNPTVTEFKRFLGWMQKFWIPKVLNQETKTQFNKICLNFYKIKTEQRINKYFDRYKIQDVEEVINGQKIPKVFDLLEKLDWDKISDGTPTRFHGDLHFENILINNSESVEPFTLLDWRQDFGGFMKYGDIYYDLAKLNHGLIICHELINKNCFSVSISGNAIKYDFLRKQSLVECENFFYEFIQNQGFDLNKVKILTALIYLNIAALHHHPYSQLLFYLGKNMLRNIIEKQISN